MKDSVKRNNTTLFLLPLGLSREEWNRENNENAYLVEDEFKIIISNGLPIYNSYIEEVFDLFQNGQYSKFPNHCKQKILAFWGITSKEERLYQILYPRSYFLEANMTIPREVEIWPKPNMDEEICKFSENEIDNNKLSKQITKPDGYKI